jgi:hypothetical protein
MAGRLRHGAGEAADGVNRGKADCKCELRGSFLLYGGSCFGSAPRPGYAADRALHLVFHLCHFGGRERISGNREKLFAHRETVSGGREKLFANRVKIYGNMKRFSGGEKLLPMGKMKFPTAEMSFPMGETYFPIGGRVLRLGEGD